MYYRVLKQSKTVNPQSPVQPVLFIVAASEVPQFLKANVDSDHVLVFDSFPAENLVTSNLKKV